MNNLGKLINTYKFQYGSAEMNEEDAWAFLESPDTRSAIFTTADEHGIPQATPIYFHVNNRKIHFNMIKDPPKKKLRNIIKNPNVCLTVDRVLPDGSFFWVSVIGTAKIIASERSTDPIEQAFVKEYNVRTSAKYHRAGVGRRFPEGMLSPVSAAWRDVWLDVLERIYLEITPVKVLSYDVRKHTQELFDELTETVR